MFRVVRSSFRDLRAAATSNGEAAAKVTVHAGVRVNRRETLGRGDFQRSETAEISPIFGDRE